MNIKAAVAELKSNDLHAGIDTMDTSGLDLNLLVTLEALLSERNVTRAARRLNISQPALSARLARLRDLLGDQLLLPAQRGMVPTRRGRELEAPLHEALESVRRVVGNRSSIDPRTAEATVLFAASDYVQYSLLMRLFCVLRTEAPGIRIAWRTLEAAMLGAQLERGEVDLALTTPEHAPSGMRVGPLYEERYVAIVRRDHPIVRDALDLDTFCSLDHVVVSPQGGGFVGATDLALERIGRRCRVALSTAGFLIVPEIVSCSDMIALIPERVARNRLDRLRVFQPPLAVPGFAVIALWHDRSTNLPVQRWLRHRLAALANDG